MKLICFVTALSLACKFLLRSLEAFGIQLLTVLLWSMTCARHSSLASSELVPLLLEELRLFGSYTSLPWIAPQLGKRYLGHNYLQCCNFHPDAVLLNGNLISTLDFILAGITCCTWDTVTYLATVVHAEATARRLPSSHHYWFTCWELASLLLEVLRL